MKQIQEISSWITSGRVAGNRISVDLPKEFEAQEVQIIIIPKKKVSRPAQDGWKKDFQSISQWDIQDLNRGNQNEANKYLKRHRSCCRV